MQLTITNSLLQNLASQVEAGRPLNALLRANEYLSESDPLRLGLVQKAQGKMRSKSYQKVRSIVGLILGGARLAELSSEQQEKVRNFRESAATQKRYFVPSFRTERQGYRMEMRRVRRAF